MLPLALGCAALLWLCFGAMRVNQQMDTLIDTVPPGSLCIVDKRQGAAQPGDAVFVQLADGGILLSRVTARAADGSLTVRNDNRDSRWPDSASLGPLPASALRGTVRVVFPPDHPDQVELPKHDK